MLVVELAGIVLWYIGLVISCIGMAIMEFGDWITQIATEHKQRRKP